MESFALRRDTVMNTTISYFEGLGKSFAIRTTKLTLYFCSHNKIRVFVRSFDVIIITAKYAL